MNEKDKAIAKIQKLLGLAKSPNEAEASVAAMKAQELMLLHDLDSIDIVTEEDKSGAEVVTIRQQGKKVTWEFSLLHEIAKAQFCRSTWKSSPCRYQVWGQKHRIAVVKEIFDYMTETVNRLAKEAQKAAKADPESDGHWVGWRKWGSDYRYGMSKRLAYRIYEHAEKVKKEGIPESNVTAIVVVDAYTKAMNEIDDIIGKVHMIRSTIQSASDGYIAGRRDADKISLNQQVAPTASMARSLPAG